LNWFAPEKFPAGEPHDGKVNLQTGKFSFLMKAAK